MKGLKISFDPNEFFPPIMVAVSVILLFLTLDNLGLYSLVEISPDVSLFNFFLSGIVAGVSSCAALVGGLLLSLSEKWPRIGPADLFGRSGPYLLFNAGRVLSYGILGFILAIIGRSLVLPSIISSSLIVVVSIFMVVSALQILGARLPLSNRFKYPPFIVGFLTIFLSCAFSSMVQESASLSFNAMTGALMMVSFALGTSIPLFLIGFFGSKLLDSRWAVLSARVIGLLILFFVAYNLNTQFDFLRIRPDPIIRHSVSFVSDSNF